MKKSNGSTAEAAKLRHRAEGRLYEKRCGSSSRGLRLLGETDRLAHELEVHQIELDLQNEELERASETLGASLNEFAELYDFAPVGYFTLDRGGLIERLNLTGARLLGLERIRLLHRRFGTFVSSGDRKTFRTFLDEVFDGRGQGSCEVAIEPRAQVGQWEFGAGKTIHVRIEVTVAENREECRALVTDVTEQTRALRALRESETRFRTLVEAMEDSVITTDRQGYVTSVRSKQLRNLGVATADFLGKSIAEIHGPEVGAMQEAAHARVLRGETMVYEWKHHVAGRELQMQTIASPLRDAEGFITGSLEVSRDVTELKRLHELVLASDRMSAFGALAASIADEVNSPLAAVIATLDSTLNHLRLVERGAAEAAPYLRETVRALGDCIASTDGVRQVVRDLRLFSCPDGASRNLIDLRRVVQASLRLVNGEIRRRATLLVELGEIPLVRANEAPLGQLFLNLLLNVASSVPEVPADRYTIAVRTLTGPSGSAVVEVTSNPAGGGISLELTVCRKIVARFGGEIMVDSEEGQGTRLRVLLPAAAIDRVGSEKGGLAVPV